MALGQQGLTQHGTRLFGHGVVTTGEHVNSRIPGFRPGVNGDVRFGQ